MKKRLYIIVLIIIISMLLILTPRETKNFSPYTKSSSHLLQPQKNVVIITMDLKENRLNIKNEDDIKIIKNFNSEIEEIEGLNSVNSILNARVIKSVYDDIIVENYLPSDFSDYREYPELMTFVSEELDALLFYLYFGYKTTPNQIYRSIEELRDKSSIQFNYTGKSPINAITEVLISNDILLLLPTLFIGIMIIFLTFRRVKAIVSAWVIIFLSVSSSFLIIKFIGINITPMILLIPVFSLGLLSDYIIHFIYHLFYAPHNSDSFKVRRSLIYPLGLTGLSTLTGFLSLVFINASGHLLLGSIIAVAVVFTFIGVMFWLPYLNFKKPEKEILPRFSRYQILFFDKLFKGRFILYIILIIGVVWGSFTLPKLKIEPYPIEQLPEKSTIKRGEAIINSKFHGALPFFIEVDTGMPGGFLKKSSLLSLESIHKQLNNSSEIGYSYSLLTVLKRINYYFLGDEDSLLTSSDYDDIYSTLIEQYLLYYSSSVDPLEYESQVGPNYRYISIKGFIKYRTVDDLNNFLNRIDNLDLPDNWSLEIHGIVKDLNKEKKGLTKNWIISFTVGCFLIFVTVLLFYKKLKLAILSLLPGFISMVLSFGLIGTLGIRIDSFSIIFVAIITGLVIDYSIHTLSALDKMPDVETIKEGFSYINHYSGIPIFLSFITSLLSFSVLFLSAFKGARSLGILLFASLIISYILSFYLLPIIILPSKIKRRKQ